MQVNSKLMNLHNTQTLHLAQKLNQ